MDNAGKSTILDRWIKSATKTDTLNALNQNPSKICPTFGFEIKTIILPSVSATESKTETKFDSSSDSIRLNFWDIGGQKSIRPFWRNYYEETDAIIWVVDSADLDRLEICRRELETVLNADVRSN